MRPIARLISFKAFKRASGMTPRPIPKYHSRPALLLLISVSLLALLWPAPFAIISPGPVTNLLGKSVKINEDFDLETSGKLFSLSVYVTNQESKPPGILVLAAWMSGKSLVLPNELVYESGQTTDAANREAKREMQSSEAKAAIAAANFLKKLDPGKALDWKQSDIEFAMKKVGGPSAGLAFSIALIARLQSPELIAGRSIAVTGTINESGDVGGIGGLDQKLISAAKAGARLAIFPQTNCRDLTIDVPGIQLLPVSNLSQAIHGLSSSEFAK